MRTHETLAVRQRRLLAAVKGREDDASRFAKPELALLRETLLWWRRLGITQSCRFTATLLSARGRFEAAVEAFVRDTPGADSIETQRDLFLAYAADDDDPLCAAVAVTEAALIERLQYPDAPPRAIAWPCDPGPVLAALLHGKGPVDSPNHAFTLTVGPPSGGGLEWCRESPRTTKLYDRTGDEITFDEVERIAI
ncbi:MAG TPA: hypothetical protein VNZ53_44565 [Steroidobacteraceae bacterium]|nr:hypothetical protein [Steroidobacteraceae bacterium]